MIFYPIQIQWFEIIHWYTLELTHEMSTYNIRLHEEIRRICFFWFIERHEFDHFILTEYACLPVYFVDINECEGSHGCSQECINTVGSFKCSCQSGFRLDSTDLKTCIRK